VVVAAGRCSCRETHCGGYDHQAEAVVGHQPDRYVAPRASLTTQCDAGHRRTPQIRSRVALRAPPLSLVPHQGITHLQRASTARRLGEALPGAGRDGYRTTATRGSRLTDIETPVLDTLVQMSANTLER
jgi:hypothetical protein